jgi:hypothetical protein
VLVDLEPNSLSSRHFHKLCCEFDRRSTRLPPASPIGRRCQFSNRCIVPSYSAFGAILERYLHLARREHLFPVSLEERTQRPKGSPYSLQQPLLRAQGTAGATLF